eukprot:31198-Pelagococcus_subviridis.AAC.35
MPAASGGLAPPVAASTHVALKRKSPPYSARSPGSGPGGGGANAARSNCISRAASNSRPSGSCAGLGLVSSTAAAVASRIVALVAPVRTASAAEACDSSASAAATAPCSRDASQSGDDPATARGSRPCLAASATAAAFARSALAAAFKTTACACARAAAKTPGLSTITHHRLIQRQNAFSSSPSFPHHFSNASSIPSPGDPCSTSAASDANSVSAAASADNWNASRSSSYEPSSSASVSAPSKSRTFEAETLGRHSPRRDANDDCVRSVPAAPASSRPPRHTDTIAFTDAAKSRGSSSRSSLAFPRTVHSESSALSTSHPSSPSPVGESFAGSSMLSASIG